MRIAILQLAPRLGKRDENIEAANRLLAGADLSNVDLLVLPEMAFSGTESHAYRRSNSDYAHNSSGYNFPSLEAIEPFLEPTTDGPSTAWARATAARLNCHVCVGYPEKCTAEPGKNYNAQVIVSPSGDVVVHYRKSFLYYTDETWASEGGGFAAAVVPKWGEYKTVVTGICMDINPYKFEASYSAYEFATYGLQAGARLVVLSTAWLTSLSAEELVMLGSRPDYDTLNYWLNRFMPMMRRAEHEEPIIVIFANRSGLEPGSVRSITAGNDVNGQPVVGYAGSSCVMGFANGGAHIWKFLGASEEGVLIVDTDDKPQIGTIRLPETPDNDEI